MWTLPYSSLRPIYVFCCWKFDMKFCKYLCKPPIKSWEITKISLEFLCKNCSNRSFQTFLVFIYINNFILGSCTFCRHQTLMLWTLSWACPVRLCWQDVRTRALDGKQITLTKYQGSYDVQFFTTKLLMRGNRKQFCTISMIKICNFACQNKL